MLLLGEGRGTKEVDKCLLGVLSPRLSKEVIQLYYLRDIDETRQKRETLDFGSNLTLRGFVSFRSNWYL